MKKTILSLAFTISFLLFFTNCNKDENEINNTTDFNTYLQEEMEDQNIPALSVLIFEEDSILYEQYLGKAHIQLDVTLQKEHLFLLASVSKVFTATALLQLYEDGLFDLDDKINDYLPFNVNIPDYNTDITFRMLLTHTSAIADGDALDDQYYYSEDSPVALDYFLENYLVANGDFYNENENFHAFNPGSEHEYSNIGNALIGLLVQGISGIEFDEYCKQNIFEPLEMNNTFWRLGEIFQTIVRPYNYANGEYEMLEHYTFTDYPNGGLRSTAEDVFKFLSAFVQDGTANNYQLLNATTINEMITPQIPSIDEEVGLHLFLFDDENNLWGHDGGEAGVATIVGFNPTTKVGAIVLANQGEADLDEILIESYKLGLQL